MPITGGVGSSRQALELPRHPRLQRSLNKAASKIRDPIFKLWFIKNTLQRFQQSTSGLRRIPIVCDALFAYISLQTFAEVCDNPRAADVPLPRKRVRFLYRLRYPIALSLTAFGLAIGFVAGSAALRAADAATSWVSARLARPDTVRQTLESGTAPMLDPPDRIGEPPTEVWLVEETNEEELWSNGLRIDTRFAVQTKERHYVTFPLDGSSPETHDGRPAGIVFHTTESDMTPLQKESSEDILATTRDLVGWLARRGIYNYVIDRFGQVYRVVSDEDVAVHAGRSIWADENNYFLDLNDSFLGVSFESRMDDESTITQAQLQSAINLTDVLRLRYDIASRNCVPHGIVSVSADGRSVGYHLDWARGFPFAAFGLEDNYGVAPPSIVLFGLKVSESLFAGFENSWTGLRAAEKTLVEHAETDATPVNALRHELQKIYLQQLELNKLLRDGTNTRAD